MKLQKYEEDEKLVKYRRKLTNWWKEIEEVDRLNRIEEFENLIGEYILEHRELTLKEIDVLVDLVDFVKNK